MAEYICELPVEGMASFVSGSTTIPVREQIVRCRDCIWCMAYALATYCDRFNSALPDKNPDGFCAWGRRAE